MPQMIGLFRLGRNAELRTTTDGTPVASLSLAYNHGTKGPDGKRPTEWIDATLWGRQAEVLTPYLTKGGMHCFTLDDVHLQTFARRDGSPGTKLVARVSSLELGGRGDGQAQVPNAAAHAPTYAPPAPAHSGLGGMDDDVPF